MNIKEMQAQRDALDVAIKDAKVAAERAAREERQMKRRAEEAAHNARMYDEIGQALAGLNEAQHAIVYAAAWGHGGYENVEGWYGELAELARAILAA